MSKYLHPPRLANALLHWYCRNAAIEDLTGDLDEIYERDIRFMSRRKAAFRYWKMVLSLIFSYAVKRRREHGAVHAFARGSSIDLYISYFTASRRSLARHRFFTIINVLGLAVGMSIALLFIAMLAYVSNYDEFHENKERLYRATTTIDDDGRIHDFASSPETLGPLMKEHLAGIEEVVHINKSLSGNVRTSEKEAPVEGFFADPSFFRIFTFPLLKGNSATALSKPGTIVLSEKTAQRIFGDEDGFGQTIAIEPYGDFEVTGIMKDHPKASHLYFEAVAAHLPATGSVTTRVEPDDIRNHYTYFLLSPEAAPEDVSAYLHHFSDKLQREGQTSLKGFSIQSITDIATGSEQMNEIGPQWGYVSFMIFGFLTLLILVPACFNYANISISRMLKRAKEIGLRKTVGGDRRQIFAQFITETVLVSLIALGGAFLIFFAIRGEFLALLVSAEGLDLTATPMTILYFIVFAIATGLLAGIIPAMYFARLNPVHALKNATGRKGGRGFSLQKLIVVSQFALSLGFIMAVVIVLKQYRATINYDFGFHHANILDVELQDADPEIVRNTFTSLSGVNALSMSSHVTGTFMPQEAKIHPAGQAGDSSTVREMWTDANYVQNLGLELIAGKTFENGTRHEREIIVNEQFLRQFNIATAADAVGLSFVIDDSVEVTVAGVLRDFHYTSLREPIRSFILRNDETKFSYANLRIVSADMIRTLEEMEDVWKKTGSSEPFRARFFSDELNETYSFYFSMIKICGFLGFLAITISCLGLLGMVVYATENRMKELGVRKVMGANSFQMAVLLSKGYVRLMIIAAFIATPITYFLFDKALLQMQYYRFGIGVGEIVTSLIIMLLLGGATILSQTVRAATANPVDTLRTE